MKKEYWKLINRVEPALVVAPDWVREVLRLSFDQVSALQNVDEARAPHVEIQKFDSTYIDFLEEQIKLNARGDEYSSILKRRLDGLRPYVEVELLFVYLTSGPASFTLRIDPKTEDVIYEEIS